MAPLLQQTFENAMRVSSMAPNGPGALGAICEALGDPTLARPDRIVLMSPMIGITSLARFAGVMGWPALLPRFAKA